MVEIITTAESVKQAKALIDADVDTLFIGNSTFGLRLPGSFSIDEMKHITNLAHEKNKKVLIAVNALMHNEHIEKIKPYLKQLEEINVDAIAVGDPGVIRIIQKENLDLPFIYDAHTMVTSAKQVNFWHKRGAIGAVLARELTFIELKQIVTQVDIPLEVLVYGATCIHQSKRPLVQNYFNFTKQKEDISKERGLFLAEPKRPETHYSVYEDEHGTHIFATDDINLLPFLKDLYDVGLTTWKLDGIYTPGEPFVEIAKLFVEAKRAILENNWNEQLVDELQNKLTKLHPAERTMNEGFFLKDPSEVQ